MSFLSTKRENGRRRTPSVDGRSQHGSEIDASWSSAASSSYDFAKGSSYPDRPRDSPDRRKLSSLGSVRLVAGAFTSCFSPLRGTREQEEQGLSGFCIYCVHEAAIKLPMESAGETVASTVSSVSSMGSKASSGRQFKIPRQEDCRAFGMLKLSYAEIARATNNFSAENEIGRGGFGVVYRGRLRDGTFVAVKRAKKGLHDYHLSAEFESEIKTLSMVEHLNLVRFFGCIESPDEWIIVVEYVQNGTLRDHLHDKRFKVLELGARLDIAIDIAHAITYLHMYAEHPIIHRDIKPANILLTDKLRAKVADFGFARFTSDDPTATHVSTQIKGTTGRMDPEYLSTMQLTEKSDVYSFGVLLVELMTGRCPIERGRGAKERVTVTWVMKKLQDGEAASLMDPRLTRSQAAGLAVENVLMLASVCLIPTRREERPSMKECAEVLWGIRKVYRDAHPV